MSVRKLDRVTGVATTSGAATSVGATYTTASGTALTFQARVNGRETTTGASVGGIISGAFKNVAGTLTIIGVVAVGLAVADAALAAAVIVVAANGTAIEVQITGVALTTIEWFVDLQLTVN